MMSYHNLHLLRYRRAPESNISKENNESGSDQNHMTANNNNNNYSNPNRQHMLPTSSSTTAILTNIQNRTQHKKHIRTKDDTKQSRIWFITHCCRTHNLHQQERIDKRSSSTTSSKATASNNILVDYCTYHDVAVSRVTCV